MAQGFDKTKPEFQAGLVSEVLRTQFNALASQHEGATEPLDVQRGMIWLDTNDPNNWKLKIRLDSSWMTIMENVNGVLFPPSIPGGGSQYAHSQVAPANPWLITHNLGKQVVSVIVVDALWNNMDPSSYTVNYVDANNCTITFTTGATSGTAYIQ